MLVFAGSKSNLTKLSQKYPGLEGKFYSDFLLKYKGMRMLFEVSGIANKLMHESIFSTGHSHDWIKESVTDGFNNKLALHHSSTGNFVHKWLRKLPQPLIYRNT